MRKIIVFLLVLGFCFLVGCDAGSTEEELAASALEAEAAEALAEEEASGIRRLDSPNLEGPEITLVSFINGVRERDPEIVANAIGAPNLFSEESLESWITAYSFGQIASTPLGGILMKVSKSGAEASLALKLGENGDEVEYKAFFEKDRWILMPPEGMTDVYSFTAPTKNIYFGELAFGGYAIATDKFGYEWTFTIPHMPLLPESPAFTVSTNLGHFPGTI